MKNFFMLAIELEVSEKREKLVVKEDISDLVREIEQAKNAIIKWIFIFWVGHLVAIAGTLFAFFNFYIKQ